MNDSVHISTLEGVVVDLGDKVKQIEEKDGAVENLEYWMEQNLPEPGIAVRIVVMSFPEE